MKDDDLVWKNIRDELQLSLSSAVYATWIAPIVFQKKESNTVYLSVTNFMNKDYVSGRFHNQFLELFKKNDPSITNIEYVIASNKKSELQDDVFGVDSTLETDSSTSNKTISLEQSTKKPSTKPSQGSTIHHTQSNSVDKISASYAPVAVSQSRPSSIMSKFTFANFIVGSANKMAFSAAQLVAEKPGDSYNPLFLYGPAGVGKTHLMWAISNFIHSEKPDCQILYITSEEFINEFLQAIRKGDKFTQKYREVDVLLVDDMQFIAGKERTQEEFFHTFNALHQNGKQIVLCSDRPPKEIPTLEERLRSRFEWGMVADIQLPDLETRIAIITNKAHSQGIDISDSVAEFIAINVESNIRELEGSLTKLIGYGRAHSQEITVEMCEQVFGASSTRAIILTPKHILEVTAQHYNITYQEIIGPKREKQIVLPRQIGMYLIKEKLGISFPKIAMSLGKKDHTTIMHGVKKIKAQIPLDTELQQSIEVLENKILSPH